MKKLNTAKGINAEIKDCDKQIKKAEKGNLIAKRDYLMGYRDSLVRVAVDMGWNK